jgi:DNA-binding MarR family transcriptional regulator
MKQKAPALDQGIIVLQTLCAHGPMSLDEIAKVTKISKATLLRLLDTLSSHLWVERHVGSKKFESLVQVRSLDTTSKKVDELIQTTLDGLAEESDCTIEWYLPCKSAAAIVLRSEPKNAAVNVIARIGYRRNLPGELDAVARIVYASNTVKFKEKDKCNTYKSGQIVNLSTKEVFKSIKSVNNKLITHDDYWNSKGVRRYAAGVRSSSQKSGLHGILALAESFTPQADTLKNSRLEMLEKTQNKILKILQTHGEKK